MSIFTFISICVICCHLHLHYLLPELFLSIVLFVICYLASEVQQRCNEEDTSVFQSMSIILFQVSTQILYKDFFFSLVFAFTSASV